MKFSKIRVKSGSTNVVFSSLSVDSMNLTISMLRNNSLLPKPKVKKTKRLKTRQTVSKIGLQKGLHKLRFVGSGAVYAVISRDDFGRRRNFNISYGFQGIQFGMSDLICNPISKT